MPTEDLTAAELKLIQQLREKKAKAASERAKRAAATRKSKAKPVGTPAVNSASDGDPSQPLKIRVRKRGRVATSPVHEVSPVSDREERKYNARWKDVITTCTKCGKIGRVDPDFGVRVVRGLEHKQSWCKECRAATNYYRTTRG